MKLACESCQAKYTVADERVAGRTFRFRCKKCGHVIVVRADAPAPPAPQPGVWHAIVDGAQVGPFERDEMLRAQLAPTTLVWREGLADWTPLGTIEELQPRDASAVDPPAVAEAADAMRLRNERNETSVLFTLHDLQRLAAPPAPAASASSREEGSGLIDIRALASTWHQPAAPGRSTPGSVDDLPVFASSSIADPIVLVPSPPPARLDRRIVVALVAMLAIVLALGTVLVIVLARDGGTARAAGMAPSPSPPSPPSPPSSPAPPLPVEATRSPPVEAAPPPPVAPIIAKAGPVVTRRKATPHNAATKTGPAQADATCTEISCTVNGYAGTCCDPYRPKQPLAPAADLPEQLDRAALARGIATIQAQRCGSASAAKGDVSVSVKVTPAGTVSTVTVKHSPDPALSACVRTAAMQGRFDKTRRGGSFAYFWRF